jgi:dihydroflavonol-4-reductase
MRLLITGGTGFIGSRLALTARQAGHEVRVTGLLKTPPELQNRDELARAGVDVGIRSVADLAQAPAVLAGVDSVVHLAAAQHEVGMPDAHFREVNVQGTAALLEASRQAGVGRFVHGSTIGVYGGRQGSIDETTPPAPENIYGRTKLEAEGVVLRAADRLPVVVVRISEVYGPGDRRLLKLFQAVQRGRFFHIGPGANLHHPIYVEDLVRGLLLAAEQPAASGEVFVLPGKRPVTTDEMVAAIAAAVEREPPRLRLPLWPFAAAAVVLETTLRPLRIQPPLHRRRIDFFRKTFTFDGGKARRVLGFVPQVDFRQGAALTARWYREIGEL